MTVASAASRRLNLRSRPADGSQGRRHRPQSRVGICAGSRCGPRDLGRRRVVPRPGSAGLRTAGRRVGPDEHAGRLARLGHRCRPSPDPVGRSDPCRAAVPGPGLSGLWRRGGRPVPAVAGAAGAQRRLWRPLPGLACHPLDLAARRARQGRAALDRAGLRRDLVGRYRRLSRRQPVRRSQALAPPVAQEDLVGLCRRAGRRHAGGRRHRRLA